MDGRIYLIVRDQRTLDIAQSVRMVEDDKYMYSVRGKDYIATKEDIYLFQDNGSARYGNSLCRLICDRWYQKYGNLRNSRVWGLKNGEDKVTLTAGKPSDTSEVFVEQRAINLNGTPSTLLIGSEGTIGLCKGIDHHQIPLHSLYCAPIVWDASVQQDIQGTFVCVQDVSRYTFKILKETQGAVGYTPLQNKIFNFVASHPDGVSSRDIESSLRMRHCNVAGRLSEMKTRGRLLPKKTIKYFAKGNPCTVWVANVEV